MNIGMLWFDNDRHTPFEQKVRRAATYYRQKYGRTPTLCYVHPSMFANLPGLSSEENACKVGEVLVRTDRSVRPNHFWIGVNGESEGIVKLATKVSKPTSRGSSLDFAASSSASKPR